MTTTDTAAALWSAIDAYGCDAAWHGALGKDATTRAAIDRAITAHVEAEVARRLAAAPDVEQWLGGIVSRALRGCSGNGARADLMAEVDRLRAAIAADKARAVEAAEDAAFIRGRDAVRKYPEGWGLVARPTPDEAEALVERFEGLAQWQSPGYDAARAALLAALTGKDPT